MNHNSVVDEFSSYCACVAIAGAIKVPNAVPDFHSADSATKMIKLLILAFFGLVLAHQATADDNLGGVVSSMDSGVAQSTTVYEGFMQNTYNSEF
jgi:hypothetical protein